MLSIISRVLISSVMAQYFIYQCATSEWLISSNWFMVDIFEEQSDSMIISI